MRKSFYRVQALHVFNPNCMHPKFYKIIQKKVTQFYKQLLIYFLNDLVFGSDESPLRVAERLVLGFW